MEVWLSLRCFLWRRSGLLGMCEKLEEWEKDPFARLYLFLVVNIRYANQEFTAMLSILGFISDVL